MKRRIRHKRRAAWAEKGKEIPKPPGYMPRDSLVENVIPREVVEQQIRDHDAMVKKELEERRAALLKGTPLRFQMTGLKMSDRVRRLFDMNNGNQKEVVQYQKQSGMKLFELREGDSGSTAVQGKHIYSSTYGLIFSRRFHFSHVVFFGWSEVVALTSRIQQLQTHMRTHKKDQSTKRGLTKLTVRRRKLLDYMERKDFESYRRVVKSLGLSRR